MLYNPENAVQRENTKKFMIKAFKEAYLLDSNIPNDQKEWKPDFDMSYWVGFEQSPQNAPFVFKTMPESTSVLPSRALPEIERLDSQG